MANGLAMTPAGRRDSDENRRRRGIPSSVPAILHTGLLLAACAAFVIAKSIATAGRVHIDDIEYWIIGTVPLALLYGVSVVIERLLSDTRRDPVARRLIATWILTLVLFCFSKDLHVYETLRSSLEAATNLGRNTAEFGLALLLAALASMITMTKFVRDAKDRRNAALSALGAGLLITAMTSLLLSWH